MLIRLPRPKSMITWRFYFWYFRDRYCSLYSPQLCWGLNGRSVNLACFSVYMFCIDRILSLTALVLVVLSLLWANRLSGKLGMARNAQQEQSSELNQYMLSVGRCRNTIKQLDKSGYFIQKYDAYIKNSYLPVILVSKKFALLKKPVNPSRFRTHPAVPELSALCIILAVFLKGGKNVSADSA